MRSWPQPATVEFHEEDFCTWVPEIRAHMEEECGELAGYRLRHSPLGDYHIDAAFRVLDCRVRDEASRCFPETVVAQMRHSLVAYRSIAELLVPCLANMLEAQTAAEAWMYSDFHDPFYREHFVHPLAVAFMGAQLLRNNHLGLLDEMRHLIFSPRRCDGPLVRYFRGERRREHTVQTLTDREKDQVIWAAWYIASVCHDVHQPYALFNRMHDAFGRLRWSSHDFTVPHRLTSHLAGHLWWEYLRWAIETNEPRELEYDMKALLAPGEPDPKAATILLKRHCRRNHSTICGLWLDIVGHQIAGEIEAESRGVESKRRSMLVLAYELAAAAAMTHDWTKANKVHAVEPFCDPDENPLGWLLLLADLLEWWARPYREVQKSRSPLVISSRFVYPLSGICVRIEERRIVVRGAFSDDKMRDAAYKQISPFLLDRPELSPARGRELVVERIGS